MSLFNKDSPPIPDDLMPRTIGSPPNPFAALEAELANVVRELPPEQPEETETMQDRPTAAPAPAPQFPAPTRPVTLPPAPGDYKSPNHASVIKDKLKALTHREMRDLVGEIFKAAGTDKDTISKTEMPDVLDRLAYGD